MTVPQEIGQQPINKIIEQHPRIGEILSSYEIGCVTCGVGICLVKDVVAIHALGAEIEARIEQEIADYLNTLTNYQGESA
jgi:anaerobic glycerol-3-phosphate dehydrogenase